MCVLFLLSNFILTYLRTTGEDEELLAKVYENSYLTSR